jgi:hypothetical protein
MYTRLKLVYVQGEHVSANHVTIFRGVKYNV